MSVKKNQMTRDNAAAIFKKFKNRPPSHELQDYVHNTLLNGHHYLFQYKRDKTRYCYCTHCKQESQLEGLRRTSRPGAELTVFSAKHNEYTVCPECNKRVQKRYAGYNHPPFVISAAEFEVTDSGALICFIYGFKYEFEKNNVKIKNPEWWLENFAYFDINRYFHMLYGFGGFSLYFDDKYTKDYLFTLEDHIEHVTHSYSGLHYCFNLISKIQKSNLKYACVEEFFKSGYSEDFFGYLKKYCSYPILIEKLVKEGFINEVKSVLYGRSLGKVDWRAKNTADFFKLDKPHLNFYKMQKDNCFNRRNIAAIQFMQKHRIKITSENFRWLSERMSFVNCLELMLNFVGFQKMQTYINKQNAFYPYCNMLSDYEDYIKLCEILDWDLNNKGIVFPQNLYVLHQRQIEEVQKNEDEVKRREEEILQLKFEDRLPRLEKNFSYSNGTYLIRPAKSAKELKKESEELHHCVYSNYSQLHLKGKTTIFLIRRCSEPDKPFFTLEYKNGHIVQCRTKYNRGLTPEVKAFQKEWLKYIKLNQKKREVA